MIFPELDLASPWTSPPQHVEVRVLAMIVFVLGRHGIAVCSLEEAVMAVSVRVRSGDETEGASYYYRTSSICRKPVIVAMGNAHVSSIEIERLNCVARILLRIRRVLHVSFISI